MSYALRVALERGCLAIKLHRPPELHLRSSSRCVRVRHRVGARRVACSPCRCAFRPLPPCRRPPRHELIAGLARYSRTSSRAAAMRRSRACRSRAATARPRPRGAGSARARRDACRALGTVCRFHWVNSDSLIADGVTPWGELPLWLPGEHYEGLLRANVAKALAAGLSLRSVEETARDTLEWARTAGEQRPTLSRERERELLEKHAGAVGGVG
jgi:hypothetical protein